MLREDLEHNQVKELMKRLEDFFECLLYEYGAHHLDSDSDTYQCRLRALGSSCGHTHTASCVKFHNAFSFFTDIFSNHLVFE